MTINFQDQGTWYSLRRYYLDCFHFNYVANLPAGTKIIDLGGKKTNKRGVFDISKYDFSVTYVNISEETNPDVLANISDLPLENNQFDVAICSEVLEHISNPIPVMKEAKRVLKPNGILLICIPFIFRIHGDPYDYARYTDYWWQETLIALKFTNIKIEKQGYFWSVFVDLFRDLVYQMEKEKKPNSLYLRKAINKILIKAKQKAVEWDRNPNLQQHPSLGNYTTGFGIYAINSW